MAESSSPLLAPPRVLRVRVDRGAPSNPTPTALGAVQIPVEGVEAALRRALKPHDLVVCEHERPLVDTAPLAALAERTVAPCVQLLGVWCEGEERTGRTVPGFRRVFWHAWPTWWRQWLSRFHGLTTTASPLAGQTIAIAAAAETAEAIASAVVDAGACCVSLGAGCDRDRFFGAPAAVVWDGIQLSGRESAWLAALGRRFRPSRTPIVALLDFPRPETVRAAHALGACAVLGKPCDAGALIEAIREAANAFGRGEVRDGGFEFPSHCPPLSSIAA